MKLDSIRSRPAEQDVDVATAAVWAFQYGYLRVLLAGEPLSERLAQLAQLPSCRQLLLLCPSDGRPPEDWQRLGKGRLTYEGRAATFSASVAGARDRQYGGHPVFRVSRGHSQLLVAVEAVGSLNTLRVVAEAMARSPRRLPPLDLPSLQRQFVTRLRDAVTRDARLRDAFRLVEYDVGRQGALEEALEAAAFGDTGDPEPRPSPASAAVPGGVGVYLAWSFVHGYLALAAGRRDVAGELQKLRTQTELPLPLARVVVLCPCSAGWSDVSSLSGRLRPVQDVAGVQLAGRSYGSFSIYRSGSEGGNCFALELATPLRTLLQGVTEAGLERRLYHREAASFTEELRTLLAESPALADHYAVLRVDDDTDLPAELDKLAETHFGPAEQDTPSASTCVLL